MDNNNNFCPVISYWVQKESDELLYTAWSLVMVRNQLPAQVVKDTYLSDVVFWHCRKFYFIEKLIQL